MNLTKKVILQAVLCTAPFVFGVNSAFSEEKLETVKKAVEKKSDKVEKALKTAVAVKAVTEVAAQVSKKDDDAVTNTVVFKTNLGNIVLALETEKAPLTVANFQTLVKSGFYDGVIFHRTIPGFMVQAGGYAADVQEKVEQPLINNEADNGLKNKIGTLSMARTSDPHSASSQFFINVADNSVLDHKGKTPSGWGYAVFAKVIEGMDVVDKISLSKTKRVGPHANVPVKQVMIEKASFK